MRPHGPWKIKTTADIYADTFVQVHLDQVIRPDGLPGQHVVVQMKAGVCILPIDDDNNVYLTREFHYAIGRESLEGVSGGIEPDESPLDTAQRELAEELGLTAGQWIPATSVDPFTTIIRSPTQLYFARQLRPTASAPEGTELITRVKMSMADAVRLVESGVITHAPTCVLVLLAARIC